MKHTIERLAHSRAILAGRAAQLKEAEINLHACYMWEQWTLASVDLKVAKSNVAQDEEDVRKQALATYAETGVKVPHPAVTIREATQADHDWGLAPSTGHPMISIARDLGKYLPED